MSRLVRLFSAALFLISSASAHVGSPDIYLDGDAGPYHLFVTIRPPQVIPGVAEILVRSQTPGLSTLSAVPLPLSGPGAEHPPLADALRRSPADAQFFSGSLWLMADGSWQVRLTAQGTQGMGTIAIPVPAVAQSIRRMDWSMGFALSIIGLVLVAALAAICGAAVREAKLEGFQPIGAASRRKGQRATIIAACVIALVLFGGKLWWDSESEVFRQRIYQPLHMQAQLKSRSDLQLVLSEPGWMQAPPHSQAAKLVRNIFVRKLDDLVLDHDHLMHLYVIRSPALDVLYHLHPDQTSPNQFHLQLPAMPPGDYRLYADIVHENGLPETLTAALPLPNGIASSDGRALTGDDAHVELASPNTAATGDTFVLPDGYRMHRLGGTTSLHAREGTLFRFELLTPDGGKPADMRLYMGMLGHAAFVKQDGTVFAHIHPNGTVSMSAFMRAQENGAMSEMDHSLMPGMIPNEVSFPYGLPSPGRYRIFVQMKHGSTIETGVFDVQTTST